MSTPITKNTGNDFSIPFHRSVTGALNERTAHLLKISNDNGKIVATLKDVAFSISSLVLTVVGIVETVARHAIALVAKLVTIMLPKQMSEWIDSHVIVPAFRHAAITAKETALAATQIVTAFMKNDEAHSVNKSLVSAFLSVYDSGIVDGFEHLHVNGFTGQETVVEETEEVEEADEPKKAPEGNILYRGIYAILQAAGNWQKQREAMRVG